MSDRVAILRAGRIDQIGTPDEIYSRPTNAFVAEFMGEVNLLPVVGGGDGRLHSGEGRTACAFDAPAPVAVGVEHTLLVRPESIRFVTDDRVPPNVITGRVLNEFSLGSRVQYHVEAAGRVLTVERLREERWTGGAAEARIGWETSDSLLLAR
jgi:spermidine/putrescine transport system ATP-binding protein